MNLLHPKINHDNINQMEVIQARKIKLFNKKV